MTQPETLTADALVDAFFAARDALFGAVGMPGEFGQVEDHRGRWRINLVTHKVEIISSFNGEWIDVFPINEITSRNEGAGLVIFVTDDGVARIFRSAMLE